MSAFIEEETFARAYSRLLELAMRRPDSVTSPRGMEVVELIAPAIRVTRPSSRFYASAARSTPMRYAAGEFVWYFGRRCDAGFISKYSSFWNGLRNPKGGSVMTEGEVNSSYGHLAFNVTDVRWNGEPVSQWTWALLSMARDPDTRQAIVHVNRPGHQEEWVKDFPCTMSFQFLRRGGAVHMVVHMRSNDLIKGLTFDFPMFSLFHETFVHNLRSLDLESAVGHLTLVAGSSHVYERDYALVEQMLSGGITELEPSGELTDPPLVLDPQTMELSPGRGLAHLIEQAEGRANVAEAGSLEPMYVEFSRAIGEACT